MDSIRPEMEQANLEILSGGWTALEWNPPGTRAAEFKRFYNFHDPKKSRIYWRPIRESK